MIKFKKIFYSLIVSIFLVAPSELYSQTVYFIDASLGNDSYPGTEFQPFKTIAKGVSTLGSNVGTLYLRAGTFYSTAKISLTKTGQANNYIKIWAYSNEKVIVDFTGNTSDGFSISGSYYHLKGLEIRTAGHNGINISGNNNIIEKCITRNCSNTGLHLTGSAAPGPSNNLILNCDSFYNFDAPIGGNADGFSAKWTVGSGNVFRGCRSWNNSDDGWDLWMCTGSITIDSCYAFRNGINIWNSSTFDGNGNGFKLGGNYVATPHTVTNCVAFDNAARGFDENHNTAGQTLYNCTSFRNKSNNFALNEATLVSGTHIVKNCLSYLTGSADNIKNAIQEKNSWQGFTVTSADFISIDTAGVILTRLANGHYPKSDFLRLVISSSLVNAGVNVGIPYTGTAPDIGAFEYGITTGIGRFEDLQPFLELEQNFPNPFNKTTTISFKISQTELVTLKVYNSLSSEVAILASGIKSQGSYTVQFDAHNLGNGIYYYVLSAGNDVKTRKMIVIK